MKLTKDELKLLEYFRNCDERGKISILRSALFEFEESLISKKEKFFVINSKKVN